MSFRRLLPLFLLMILSFTLMTYQSNKGVLTPLAFLSIPLNYVNSVFGSLSTSVKEPFRNMTLKVEENRRLREEVNRLITDQQRYRDIYFENQRLRELLSLKERERRYVATAHVVSKGWDRWANTLIVDKGRTDGVEKDMAVITPRGLVGKVSNVTDRYASVLLITDINFSAAVKIQETRKDAIFSGTGSGSCILKYIPQEEKLNGNEVVVTSGFDDLFPPEVPVGLVSLASGKSSGIFQKINVTPFQDLSRLDEVVVIRR
ncbi:MAG TPA: rod shape-determining protein MreC [Thermodesulfovibrionales bacterium]|jgi:rod shape-determining protein MreC|nr:rod shape-determining protein MreC [Thermodesulfovibrionales bacterium]